MITKLNTSFEKNTILHASQLVAIKSKVNEIIENLSSESGDDGGASKSYVDKAVQDAIDELTELMNQADQRLSNRIATIENAQPGNTSEKTDEEWLEIFKKTILTDDDEFTEGGREIMNAAMFNMGVCNEQGQPYFSTTVQQNIENLGTRVSSLEVLPNQVSLLVENLIEKRNGVDVIKRAGIIAAINESNESIVGISADKIILGGGTVLAEKINAIDQDVQTLKASSAQIDQAAIKQAVINDLNATNLYLGGGTSAFYSDGSGMLANNNILWTANGNVTINGTLHYNRIVGNTVGVSSSTTLNNDAYFVMYKGTGYSQPYPVITLPSNPITGQTLFLEVGNRYFNIKASHNMRIYMMEYDQNNAATGNAVRDTIQAGQERLVSSLSWNGVVQFIFDGTQWIQLTHNISL